MLARQDRIVYFSRVRDFFENQLKKMGLLFHAHVWSLGHPQTPQMAPADDILEVLWWKEPHRCHNYVQSRRTSWRRVPGFEAATNWKSFLSLEFCS
jgi:hypothetical protein